MDICRNIKWYIRGNYEEIFYGNVSWRDFYTILIQKYLKTYNISFCFKCFKNLILHFIVLYLYITSNIFHNKDEWRPTIFNRRGTGNLIRVQSQVLRLIHIIVYH